MSASTPALGHAIDISSTTPTPFLRLVRVEMRKAWDTRAGLWLLLSTALLCAAVMVIQLAVGITQEDVFLTYNSFLTSTNFSIAVLLPVIGIMLLTSESCCSPASGASAPRWCRSPSSRAGRGWSWRSWSSGWCWRSRRW